MFASLKKLSSLVNIIPTITNWSGRLFCQSRAVQPCTKQHSVITYLISGSKIKLDFQEFLDLRYCQS